MLIQGVNFLRGSVRIEVRGAGVERFFNICAANGIDFWGVRRTAGDCLEASVRIGGFFALRPFARRCMCRIHVVEKRGAPFYGRRLRRRRALLTGAVLCAVFLYVLSGFVWTIGIEGCESVTQAEVMMLLEQNGLRVGARTAGIDTAKLRNNLLRQSGRLSYLAVNLRGSHAQVIVRERGTEREPVDVSTPCDVVADRPGVIARLIVRNGAAAAEVGKTVAVGDLLAGGSMVSQQGEVRLVHADAEATVRTWRTVRLALSERIDGARETGAKKTRRALIIGAKRFNLYFVESAPFACYDKKVEKKSLSVSENLLFPLALVTETYTELERCPLELSEEKCAETLHGRLRDMLRRQAAGAAVTELDYRFEKREGFWLAALRAECLERCGVQVPLGASGGQP